eukprot:632363-Amphidinium_carterae.2
MSTPSTGEARCSTSKLDSAAVVLGHTFKKFMDNIPQCSFPQDHPTPYSPANGHQNHSERQHCEAFAVDMCHQFRARKQEMEAR